MEDVSYDRRLVASVGGAGHAALPDKVINRAEDRPPAAGPIPELAPAPSAAARVRVRPPPPADRYSLAESCWSVPWVGEGSLECPRSGYSYSVGLVERERLLALLQ
jgi:hypothetical protein